MSDVLRPAVATSKPAGVLWAVPGRKVDLLASFRAHRKLASWVGGVVVVMGLLVAVVAGRPRYLAEAAVRVAPNFPKTLQEDVEPRFGSNSDYRDYVQQQVVEIESPQTTANALKLLGPRRNLWQRPNETDYHAAERLMWALKVQAVPGTYLITVGLEGQRASGIAEIVNAVVASYLARQQGQEASGSDQRVLLLTSRRAQLELQIDELRKQESQLAGELGVSTFAPGFASPYDKMVGDANAALYVAGRNLIQKQARLTALQDDQRRVNQLEVDSTAQQMLAGDHEVSGANAQLISQRAAAMVQLEGLGPNHPGRPALEQQIRNIDNAISQTDTTTLDALRATLIQSRDTRQRQAISEAQAHVDEAQLATEGIEQEVTKLRASTASFGAKYNQALSNRDEIDRMQKNVQAIDDRVDFLRLEAPAPGFVRIESPAQTPDIAEKGGRRKIFALFVVAALVLVLGVPAGVDLIDPRVKTLDELEGILDFAPLGTVMQGSIRTINEPSDLEMLEDSDRLANESLRRVAFAIIREWRASGVRTFVMVPVSGNSGNTTLTLALALELSNLGRPTVAIEANQFSPDVRYANTSGIHKGLANGHANGSLYGKAPNGRTHDGSHDSLATFTYGQDEHLTVPASATSPRRVPISRQHERPSLTLGGIEHLITLALASNDLVLLDAPPLAMSGDAEMLIQLPAAAILVVRQGCDLMPKVVAAVRALEKLSPAVVGAILNGIATHRERSGDQAEKKTVATARCAAASAVEESLQA